MAISIRIDTVEPLGNSTLVTGSFVPDTSYPTGGEAFAIADTQNDVTLERLTHVAGNGGGYIIEWDKANQKAKLMFGDNNNAADGPLIEVANTTDLSAVTVNFLAIGQ